MSVVKLVEEPDRWVLPLAGLVVTQCCVDYAFTLTVADVSLSFETRIERSFDLLLDGSTRTVDVDGGPTSMAPALAMMHREMADAVAFKDGRLELRFADGGRVLVPVDERFEAWTLTGSGDLRLVSLPGGELAVWSPIERAEVPKL